MVNGNCQAPIAKGKPRRANGRWQMRNAKQQIRKPIYRCVRASRYEGLSVGPLIHPSVGPSAGSFECAKTPVFDFGRRGEGEERGMEMREGRGFQDIRPLSKS